MIRNASGQKLLVIAYSEPAHTLKTGDAANITLQISKDGGTAVASDDVNPTELDATNLPGIYAFDLTQAETLCQKFLGVTVSLTTNVVIDPVILDTVSALERYNGSVWLDAVDGDDGTVIGINGTIDKPVKTWADVETLLADTGLHKISIKGTTPILDRDIPEVEFNGVDSFSVFLANPTTGIYSLHGSRFQNIQVIGAFKDGDGIICKTCLINGITIERAYFIECAFKGINKIIDGGDWNGLLTAVEAPGKVYFDFQTPTLPTVINLQSFNSTNNTEFMNMNNNSIVNVSGYGKLDLQGSGGTISSAGIIEIINNAGATVEQESLNVSISNILNTPQTEEYSAKGVVPSVNQVLLEIIAELRSLAFAGKTQFIKKLDGVTEAYTNTIDSVEEPTSKIRAT